MTHRYAEIAFTDRVKAEQETMGSRSSYARLENGPDRNGRLTEREIGFIAARDSFYMATVGETGWPYIQHRGGPAGFTRVLDDGTLAFADYSGNRQYVSVGNLAGDNRVSLFFMDYANRARLKLFGRARTTTDAGLLDRLTDATYGGIVERGVVIAVEAFDWNCPQHIVRRFDQETVARALLPLQSRVRELEAQLARLQPEDAS